MVMEARFSKSRTEQPEPKESQIHAAVVKECKARGWIVFHGAMNHRSMRTIGEPDLTVMADNGRVFFVELKTRTGKLSPEQLGLTMLAERLGHKIHVVRSLVEFREIVK